MSTQVLSPTSDFNIQSNVTKTPGGSSAASILSDGSDSTFVSFSSTGNNAGLFVTLGALSGVASISAASITLRALVSSTKSQSYIQARLYKSDGTTGLCNFINLASGFAPTTSFSNITINCSGLDTTVADWTGAILFFGGQNDGNSNTFEVAEAKVTLTVTLSSTGSLFRQSLLNGIGSGGPFFANPLGDRPDRNRVIVCEKKPVVPRRKQILVPAIVM